MRTNFKLATRQIYLSLNFHLHLKSEVLFAPEECRKVWVFTETTTTKMRLNFNLFFFLFRGKVLPTSVFFVRGSGILFKAKLIEFTRFISDFLM